jgi:hypothetical protein
MITEKDLGLIQVVDEPAHAVDLVIHGAIRPPDGGSGNGAGGPNGNQRPE